MSEPFVLAPPSGPRWVIHPLEDLYGDGYVYAAATELHDDDMKASTVAKFEGLFVGQHHVNMAKFVEALAAGWSGWDGVRRWWSLEEELELDARHDGRGYVSLGVTLRASGLDLDDTRWSARTVFKLEAGEEMTRLAADLTYFLRPQPG
ncbi:hypothetical protein GCM10027290_50840 [Micromonospora sonneratiae]|uniref:DUF6228 family protein n=1 Tax=Micromonospora sonneratiae TaxID=1184706 RepID=A0ABW3Y7D4_9ACTN